MRLLRRIAKAVVNNGLKALASVVPLGGALYDIAEDAWRRYREPSAKDAASPEALLKAEVEALAQAPAIEVRQQVADAMHEAAADQPSAVQAALTSYLTQVPAMIRRSLRRPSDPGGTTLAAKRALRKPADLLPFLPPKLPRFQPGDRPLPGVNWVLEELLDVGGFGEVWKAHHPDLTGITAALKFCLDPEAGATLRHEARALNRVMQAAGGAQRSRSDDRLAGPLRCRPGRTPSGQRDRTGPATASPASAEAGQQPPKPAPKPPTDADDLAAQVERTRQRIPQAHAEAKQKAERERDFAGAARLLEEVPEHLRDVSQYAAICGWRDRAAILEQEVRADGQAMRLNGLRPKVEELLQLFPQRTDLQRLLATLPKELAREFVNSLNSLGMKFAIIPAGKFVMGSPGSEAKRSADEGPQHEVEITRPFYLGSHQVTQEQYKKVMGNPSRFTRNNGGGGANHPVEQVSWEEAVAFCRKLSAQSQEKASGRAYRLPTEAEWEYACRGGATSSSPFFLGDSLSSTQANFNGNYPYGGAAKGPYLERTTPVGSYKPNAFGLFDMHGNAWDWCSDWYDENYYNQSPRQDPQGPQIGTRRVLRGGSWINVGHDCRSGYRDWHGPGYRYHGVGFRVACLAPRTS